MSADFEISRSITIATPPSQPYARVADFRSWRTWSPWEDADPKLSREYSGADTGAGAKYSWSGNRKAGAGSMEILDAVPNEVLGIDLRFLKPFKAQNRVRFGFHETSPGKTEVTWTMAGKKLLPMRLLGAFISMDKMIGPDFERGLLALKRDCEANPA